MTSKERAMLVMLAAVAALAISAINGIDLFSFIADGTSRERAAKKLLADRGLELSSLDRLQAEVDTMEASLRSVVPPEKKDLLSFGDEIKARCKSLDVAIERYTIIVLNSGRMLEFSVIAAPERLVRFLADLERGNSVFSMVYLNARISKKDGTVTASFRIAERKAE